MSTKFTVVINGREIEGIVSIEYTPLEETIRGLIRNNCELIYGAGEYPIGTLGDFKIYKNCGQFDDLLKISRDDYFKALENIEFENRMSKNPHPGSFGCDGKYRI